jgi:CIC family chloride channel protein
LPFYLLLGLLSGFITVYIANIAGKLEKGIFKQYNRYVRAILGGLLLGLMILVFPPLLGEGYHYMQEVLNGNIEALKEQSLFPDLLSHPWAMLLFVACLVFVKIVAAGITIGAGGNGGTFAPSMFTGAFLGLLVAYGINQTGLIHLNTSNFIAVGMAGAISGVMHAPLTAIFLIAEITGGYILFIPLMIVSAISYIISRAYNPHNMYWHHLIAEKNIHPDADHSMLDAISLKSMVNKEYTVIKRDMLLKDFFKLVAETTTSIFAVLSAEGKVEGVVFLSDVRKYMFSADDENKQVTDVMTIPPAIIDYTEPVSYVMSIFDTYGVWHLPVIKDGVFIGFISKAALFIRYREVMVKQHKEADIFIRE